MANTQASALLRHVRQLAEIPGSGTTTDQELVRQFLHRRDEQAFEVLVARHGPAVLRLCCRLLPTEQDAEDAFQATFLLLARKVSSLRSEGSVGSWLYGVALRVAQRARHKACRRRAVEGQAPPKLPGDLLGEVSVREAQAILDEELARLPEKYRAPLVLCCLEGKTRDEAAGQLGCSVSTFKGRLEMGRERLRGRLARRGLVLSVPLLAATLGRGEPLSDRLLTATVRTVLAAARPRRVPGLLGLLGILAGLGLAAAAFRPEAPLPGPSAPEQRAETRTPQADLFGDPLPPGAVLRLGTVRLRHSGWVNSVAFSPGGTILASASWDKTIRLWDAATGRELRCLRGHTNAVMQVTFSADGKTLVSAGNDGTVRVWDATTGRQRLLFVAHQGSTVHSVALSSDGKVLASGGGGNGHRSLCLWDAATGRLLHTLVSRGPTVDAVALSPDGKVLASGDGHGNVHLWDIPSGEKLRDAGSHVLGVSSLAFSPDGKRLLSASKSDTIGLWDVGTGKQVWRVQGRGGFPKPQGFLAAHVSGVLAVAFAPDGKTFASGNFNGTIHLRDAATGKTLRTLPGDDHTIRSVAFSPDGRTLAAGSYGHAIRLWDVRSGKERLPFAAHAGSVQRVIYSPDGKLIASVSHDDTLRLWDAATGKQLRAITGHRTFIYCIAFSPDGRLLAGGGDDKAVHLWDVRTGAVVRTIPHGEGRVLSLAFAPDGKVLASGSWVQPGGDHGTIRLWDPASGKELRRFLEKTKHGFWTLRFSPDGKTLAAASYDTIHLLDVRTGKERRRFPGYPGFDFSPDGKLLVSEGRDRVVRLWSVATGKGRYFRGDQGDRLTGYHFAPDGRTLAWAGKDSAVRLWEVASGRVRRCFVGHEGEVVRVAFSPDGKRLVSASEDATLLVWDVYSAPSNRSRPTPCGVSRATTSTPTARRPSLIVPSLQAGS